MSLPDDFSILMRPRSLKLSPGWYENICYERRFKVQGYRKAFRQLPRQLETGRPRRVRQMLKFDGPDEQRIFAHIPKQWRESIEDELDSGNNHRNTYWKYTSANQVSRTYEGKWQTLPSALSSIAALDLALSDAGIDWDPKHGDYSVAIRPSIFRLDGYDRLKYVSHVQPDEAATYNYCRLEMYDERQKPIDTFLEAVSATRSTTWHTAFLLKRKSGLPDPIKTVPRVRSFSGPAKEIFLTRL